MKIINFSDIKQLNISPNQCYTWVEEMLKEKSKTILPPKTHIAPAEAMFCNVMPSFLNNNFAGVKVVTRYPNRIPSLDSQILLMDAKEGTFLALLDGNWITAMRTGAVSAHSIMLLAKKDFSVIGMMGLGNVARATLLVLAEKNNNRPLSVKLLKYKNQEIDFAKRFEKYNIKFSYVDTPEEMVSGSDVVISAATYLPNDICSDECFDEGVLVVPIHTRGFTNCDLFFDKVFADDYGHVCDFKYFNQFKKFAEVADVVTGKVSGRENDTERILAYNIGLSIHDIYFASKIYELVKQDGNIKEIGMNISTEKFWV